MKYTLRKTQTLLEAILDAYKGVSRQKAKQIIAHSFFSVDGKRMGRNSLTVIQSGSVLEISDTLSNTQSNTIPKKNNPVSLYFEDEYLIAGLKPAGIISCGNNDGTTNNSYHKVLEHYLSDRDRKKIRLWIVHRLDKEVEGLILFAKSAEIQNKLKDNWKSTTKKYLALTENMPDPPEGTIENWLMDTTSLMVNAFNYEVRGSKFAKTQYKFLRKEGKYFLIEVLLHTGRKNQIRVHLSGMKCPIVGDIKYGADSSVKRQIRLAAYMIEFPHPVTGNYVKLEYKPVSGFFRPKQDKNENYKII